MNEKLAFYILFEEAEDSCYGDFLVDRKLYSETEVEAYVKENAEMVFPPREIDGEFGIKCTFLAQSQDHYGTGLFRFVEVHR